MTELQAYIQPQIVAICLLFGSYIKTNTRIKNNHIPLILSVVGAVVAIGLNGLNFSNVLGGVISGMISVYTNQVWKGYKEDKVR